MCIVTQKDKKKKLLRFFLLFSLNNHFISSLSLSLSLFGFSSLFFLHQFFFLSSSLANSLISLIPQLAGQLPHRRYVLLTQLADPPQAPSPISLSPIAQFVPLSLSLSLSLSHSHLSLPSLPTHPKPYCRPSSPISPSPIA